MADYKYEVDICYGIQSTCWEKAQQMENAEFLKLVDKVEAKRWLKDVLASSAFAKYEPTKNEEDF